MYERILIPLDGSEIGEAALPHVVELVNKVTPGLKVEVTLFQVVSSLTHAVVAGGYVVQAPYTQAEIEQIKNQAMDYLDKAGEELISKGAIVKTKVGIGNAANCVIIIVTQSGIVALK